MSFLNLKDKTYLISGVANKKSIAYFVAKSILDEGGNLVLTVQSEDHLQKVEKLFPEAKIYLLDVEKEEDFTHLRSKFQNDNIKLDGILHSIAFANYSEGIKPFHETKWDDFSQASMISHFSLINMAKYFKEFLSQNASVVAMSISNTRATSYGYMGPIKAALDSSVSFLAKSFSEFSNVRFNAVCAGPLKTSASAGIPGYIDNYIFAEQLILRKEALKTDEVSNTVLFLLSDRSSGINAANLVVDAGMSCNYFDQNVVKTVANHLGE